MEPTWKKLAGALAAGPVGVGKYDCTAPGNEMGRGLWNIQAFPTLMLFHGKKRDEFRGNRNFENFMNFLKAQDVLTQPFRDTTVVLQSLRHGGVAHKQGGFHDHVDSIRLLLSSIGLEWKEKRYAPAFIFVTHARFALTRSS